MNKFTHNFFLILLFLLLATNISNSYSAVESYFHALSTYECIGLYFKSTESGQEIHVVARFEIKLSDYEIPRPQFLIMKLDEVQRITVDIRGVVK